MKSNGSICIIGGYDSLSRSYFKELKIKYKSVIFVNLLKKNYSSKDLYNYQIFELKKILNLLKLNNVSEIIFLGKITRPNLKDLKNDGVIEKYFPMLLKAYKKGDGSILKSVIKIFKEKKFNIVSPLKYSDKFTINREIISNNYKNDDHFDIKKSVQLLDELSKFDNAQSVVIINGYIMAIEAVEGTDSLLRRVRKIRIELNQLANKSGFLTKKPKKNQSKLIDLPVIGPKTIKLIKKANLKGLAIDLKNTIIYNKKEVLRLVDQLELTVYDLQ